MIILDRERLSDFFNSVASGFQVSPLEIIAALLLLAAFAGILVLIYNLQLRSARREKLRRAGRRFEQIATQKGLTPAERALVDRLAAFLRDSAKKYLLLVSQTTFNYCASRARQEGEVPAASLARLRHRLGFRLREGRQAPPSTASLAPGQRVLIHRSGASSRRPATGTIVAVGPAGLEVRLGGEEPAARSLASGAPVEVSFRNSSGVFSFVSHVAARSGGRLGLAHSEDLRRVQRRRYFRREVRLPVAVRAAGGQAQALRATLLDLSGQGASLTNPEGRFSPGDDLELSFSPAEEELTVVAEVLRASRGGGVLHVRFGPMREALRDRIIGSLFRAAAAGSKA